LKGKRKIRGIGGMYVPFKTPSKHRKRRKREKWA